MRTHELVVDVTDAAGLGEPAHVAVTVVVPSAELLSSRPTVCFAKPGAGFSRGYFTCDLPGPASGAQAAWHAARGWIFVAVDHLGVGGSSVHDIGRTDYATVAAASDAAEREILDRLGAGTLVPDLPAVDSPTVLGLGQSMGGSLVIAQQARHRTFHGVGVLGYGVMHSRVAAPNGVTPIVQAWRLRDDLTTVINAAAFESEENEFGRRDIRSLSRWMFFYDDVEGAETLHVKQDAPWGSDTYPGVVLSCLTPGVVAPEAAAIDVPVLVAMGERDVVADPKGEPRAYLSATAVDLFVCLRMGHMHNFAGTRELLWQRIHAWGEWVAAESATR